VLKTNSTAEIFNQGGPGAQAGSGPVIANGSTTANANGTSTTAHVNGVTGPFGVVY